MEIRRADFQDYGALVSLTELEGWNYSLQDFLDMEATGCTTTFVAVGEGKVKGMITVMDYGQVGWISNMLVEKASRGKKLGGDLLEEGIKALEDKRTITLFAYMDAKRFYLRHGFRCDRDFPLVRFIGGRKGSAREGGSTEEVFAMDEECFGFNRRGLLRMLMGKGRTLLPPSGAGYAIVRPDPREALVGPVVAEEKGSGMELLYAGFNMLGTGSLAVVPDGKIDGVEEVIRVSRLFLGERPSTDFARVFAFAGLEFG